MRVLSRSKKAAARAPSGPAPAVLAMGSRDRAGASAGPRLSAIDLDDERIALAAARANRGAPEPAAAPAQLVDQRAEDASPRDADGVTERHSTSVDVDLLLVDAQHPDRVQRHRGKGLVDLPQ